MMVSGLQNDRGVRGRGDFVIIRDWGFVCGPRQAFDDVDERLEEGLSMNNECEVRSTEGDGDDRSLLKNEAVEVSCIYCREAEEAELRSSSRPWNILQDSLALRACVCWTLLFFCISRFFSGSLGSSPCRYQPHRPRIRTRHKIGRDRPAKCMRGNAMGS